mgnify:CR=1 FL=1
MAMSEAKQLVSSAHQAAEAVARAAEMPEAGLPTAETESGLTVEAVDAGAAFADERDGASEAIEADHPEVVSGALETGTSSPRAISATEEEQLNPARVAPARPLRPGLQKGLRPGLSA